MGLRGFIAAPLLGTLVFLAAIVFVVHMTQVEKSEVQGIVSDIYHNRITTMLEDYRYDMGALFSVSLSKAIEKYLSSECWEVFAIKNENLADAFGTTATEGIPLTGFPTAAPHVNARGNLDYDNLQFCANTGSVWPADRDGPDCDRPVVRSPVCVEQCNGQLDYHELRLRKCSQITEIISDGICPYDPKYGLTAWLKATLTPLQFEGVSFSLSNPELVQETVSQIECCFDGGSPASAAACRNGRGVSDRLMFGFGISQARELESSGFNQNSCFGRWGDGNPQETCPSADASKCACAVKDSAGRTVFDCRGEGGRLIIGEGIRFCKQLVGDSLFDCRNFAENNARPFQCCDKFYYNQGNARDRNNGKCCVPGLTGNGCDGTDHVIEGCEQGSFFINVSVLKSDDVFKKLPRVQAQDRAGNQIRSGALGDRNFLVHIKYPVYKYLDAAFRMYAPIAYGVSGDAADFRAPEANMRLQGNRGSDEGGPERERPTRPATGQRRQDNNEGVIEGLCYGAGCRSYVASAYSGDKRFFVKRFRRSGTQSLPPNPTIAKQQAKDIFFNTFFAPTSTSGVCRLFEPPSTPVADALCKDYGLCDTKVFIRGMSLTEEKQLCPQRGPNAAPLGDGPAIKTSIDPVSRAENCGPASGAGGSPQCVSVEDLRLTIRFIDLKPETLVSPQGNQFCWHLRPVHIDPQVKAGVDPRPPSQHGQPLPAPPAGGYGETTPEDITGPSETGGGAVTEGVPGVTGPS